MERCGGGRKERRGGEGKRGDDRLGAERGAVDESLRG